MPCLKAVTPHHIVQAEEADLEAILELIGKLMVHPEHQGNGLGSCLLQELEKNCPAPRLELFTSNKSLRNLCLYERNGYTRCAEKAVSPALTLIFLEKKPSHPASAQNPV